ncbi:MAG: hypothetical protein ABW045_10790 [Gaiellaceae bacterium]
MKAREACFLDRLKRPAENFPPGRLDFHVRIRSQLRDERRDLLGVPRPLERNGADRAANERGGP